MSEVTEHKWTWDEFGQLIDGRTGRTVEVSGICMAHYNKGDGGPNAEANANLIATALELLGNAEKWVDLVSRIFAESAIPVSANIAMDLQQGLDETKALIAKSKGDV